MAEIQRYLEHGTFYSSPPQPEPRFVYEDSNSIAVLPDNPMAHTLLSPFRQQNRTSQPQYQLPQAQMTGDLMSAHTASWNQQAVPTDHASWTGVSGEPQTDMSMNTNSDLLYSHVAGQHALGKPTGLNGLPLWHLGGMNIVTSSPSADLLLSPVSPCTKSREIYSPGPGYTPATPDCSSMSYGMSAGVATTSSSPDFMPLTPLTPQSMMGQQHGACGFPDDSKVSTTCVAPFLAVDATTNTSKQTDTATWWGSDSPYGRSQAVSPGATSWCPPGYVLPQVSAAQDFHDQQTVFDARPNSTMLPFSRRSMQRVQWSNKGNVPTQNHFQSRFVAPLNDGERTQRKKDDELLLQMKRDGRTYRDIRKALGRKVAESTLRGRYRSLTKPRKERVRAPKWTGVDVALLKKYVQEELDKLDVSHPHLDKKQKLDKVAWMKIVDSIATTGGTYRFGAATAKKKWIEVTRDSPGRSSRRRSQPQTL